MRISIRQRLTFWYAVALVAGLCAFGLVMWLSLQKRLAGVDARVAERLQGIRMALGSETEIVDRRHLQQELDEFSREVPDGSFIQLRDSKGGVILPSGTHEALGSQPGRQSLYTEEVAGLPFRIGTCICGRQVRSSWRRWRFR